MLLQPLIALVYKKEKSEGNFRHLHASLRQNAEAIAFHRGEGSERHILDNTLDDVLDRQQKIVIQETALKLWNTFAEYTGSVVCYGIIAQRVFDGVYRDLPPEQLSALISRNAFVSMYLSSRFSAVAILADTYADICGYAARIAQLLEKAHSDLGHGLVPTCSNDPRSLPAMIIRDLTVSLPWDTVPLIRSLSLSIETGHHHIITGRSGIGKSSLMRSLAGLWAVNSEASLEFVNLKTEDVMFVPQGSYLGPLGSARRDDPSSLQLLGQHIAYPYPPLESQQTLHLLSLVGLSYLANRALDSRAESETFSAGEKQGLQIARVLHRRPRIAILDEPTSNVGADVEKTLFQALTEAGVTLVVVTHRAYEGFNGTTVHIGDNGSWTAHRTHG
ncbi:ATP-binding cassette sub- D member 4 [Thoreauomyces humboldtii]|nr:ATP-binding cassette sub- D member 4 [Thoreauomyces humboldtii]